MKSPFIQTLWMVTALVLLGCAKDRTQAEYEREKLIEDYSSFRAASGVYVGPLTSRLTGAQVGMLSAELDADISPTSTAAGANASTSRVPTMRITLSFLGDLPYTIVVPQTAFEPIDGDFSATIPVTTSGATSQEQVFVRGKVSGDSLKGGFEAAGYGRHGYNFDLTKGASSDVGAGGFFSQESESARTQTFCGEMMLPEVGLVPAELRIEAATLTQEGKFLDLLRPRKSTQVSLFFGAHRENAVVFNPFLLDENSGSFDARVQYGSAPAPITLSCVRAVSERRSTGAWSCTYTTGNNKSGAPVFFE